MTESTSLALVQNIIDAQENLIAIFSDSKLVLANGVFLRFFSASSIEDFLSSFRNFEDSFVLHPTYFNREKIASGENWLESILKLSENERMVSMMTPSYEPHAFSVGVGSSIENYTVVTFTDITQTLIKRIMIESNTSIDIMSGAYDKKYFLHIAKSYEDAANFNEKLIGITKIILNEETLDDDALKLFVQNYKKIIREDDMLVRWDNKEFILVYLIDDALKAKSVVSKLEAIKNISLSFVSVIQNKDESINKLIKRL